MVEAGITRYDLVGVGLGTPGPLNIREGRIIRAANLSGWADVDLCTPLGRHFQTAIAFDNDGNAAAYGEYWAGAGRDERTIAMLTLGTGVGAGLVIDGEIFHGHYDNAAELGHMIVAVNGLPCACGQSGCLEQYASATSVASRVKAAMKAGESCSLAQEDRAAFDIDARHVEKAARAGDGLCSRIWDEACLYLAIACINIQHAYNTECIVLGGGLANAGAFLLDRVIAHFREQRWSLHNDFPVIRLASLAYDAGVIGAAGLAWNRTR
jgi:glucokinase